MGRWARENDCEFNVSYGDLITISPTIIEEINTLLFKQNKHIARGVKFNVVF